ncbi:MAG: hypothetical protein A3F83_07165 [Candidatus Glassbacteria bacterium RIFCSPLOWO2_12_FULL_58_11]|uniref:Uncharacterized protein n=1 Tax=Candidatus Glassbacteria bacterium RIFCSPLOWO2_12_FULL_58_11 TaxID=1817867 RepID=A0A1F5YKV3_9BACT|nr:MAG: hypothetical protein A3F83_07165 [Candidatus Glassbacteria bacterium RIFCSPLOWO2_12_FULL_58_11]
MIYLCGISRDTRYLAPDLVVARPGKVQPGLFNFPSEGLPEMSTLIFVSQIYPQSVSASLEHNMIYVSARAAVALSLTILRAKQFN